MRPLTFAGFLRARIHEISGQDTLSIPALATLSTGNRRLEAPLVLWAVVAWHPLALAAVLEGRAALQHDIALLMQSRKEGGLEATLATGGSPLRPVYAELWWQFVERRDAPAREAASKLAARERILALAGDKRVSRYRIAKDLGINPGNLHAFLVQGNPSKLSLSRVHGILGYLEDEAQA